MKNLKKILLIVLIIIVVLSALFFIFKNIFSQKVIEPFEINSSGTEHKLLIASQGSDFKEALVSNVIDIIKNRGIYIKVIDVTEIQKVAEEDWDKILIITTYSKSRLQEDAAEFLKRINDGNKYIMIVTSFMGSKTIDDAPADVISSASDMGEINSLTESILEWMGF